MSIKKVISGIIALSLILILFSALSRFPLIEESYAIKGCYVCYWNAQFEKYECLIFLGVEGGDSCTAQGQTCTITGHCTS